MTSRSSNLQLNKMAGSGGNNLLSPDQPQQQHNRQRRKSTLSGNGFFIDYSCTRRRSSAALQARGQADLRNQLLRVQVSPVRWARGQSISATPGGPTLSHPNSPSRTQGQPANGASRLSRASCSAAYLPRGSFLTPRELDQSRKASVFEPLGSGAGSVVTHLLAGPRRKSTMVTGGAVLLPPPARVVEHMTSALSAAARGSPAGASRYKRELALQVPVIGCSPTSIRASLAALDETRRCEKVLRQLRRRQHRKEKRQRKREKRLARGLSPEGDCGRDEDDPDDPEEAGGRWRASGLRRKSVRAIRGAAELLRPGRRRTRNDLLSVSSIDLASSRSSLNSLEQQFAWKKQRSEDRLDPDELYLDDNTLANFGESPDSRELNSGSNNREEADQRGAKPSLMRSAFKKLSSTISGKPAPAGAASLQSSLRQQRASRASRALSVAAPSSSYLYYYYYLCEDSLDEIDDLPLGAAALVLSQAERRAQLHMNYSLARIRILNSNSRRLDRLASQETASGGEELNEDDGRMGFSLDQSTDISLALSSSSSTEELSECSSSQDPDPASDVVSPAPANPVPVRAAQSSSSGSLCNSSSRFAGSFSSTSASPSRPSSASGRLHRPLAGPASSSSFEDDYHPEESRHRLAPCQSRSHSPAQSRPHSPLQASLSQLSTAAGRPTGQSLSASPSWQAAERPQSPQQRPQVPQPARAGRSGKRSASFADSVEGGQPEQSDEELDDFERFNRCYKPAHRRQPAETAHFDRRFSKLRLSLKSPRSPAPQSQESATARRAQVRKTSMSWDTLSGEDLFAQQQRRHSKRLPSGSWRPEPSRPIPYAAQSVGSNCNAPQLELSSATEGTDTSPISARAQDSGQEYCRQCQLSPTSARDAGRARSHSNILNLGLDQTLKPRLERGRTHSTGDQRRCTSASLRVPRRSRGHELGTREQRASQCNLGATNSAPNQQSLSARSATSRNEVNTAATSSQLKLTATGPTPDAGGSLPRARALSTGAGSGLQATANSLSEDEKLTWRRQQQSSDQVSSPAAYPASGERDEQRPEQLDILALLRKNSFTCMILGAHQTGKRTIVKCFVKLLDEFRQAVDEYRKEKVLSKLMDCSEQLQGLAASSDLANQQANEHLPATTPPERSRLNSWLGGGAVNRLLHLPTSGNKRRMNSMVAGNLTAQHQPQRNSPDQRRHTTTLEPVTLELTESNQTESVFGSSYTLANQAGGNNASSNYLSVAGSATHSGGAGGGVGGAESMQSVFNRSDHDISYSCTELDPQDSDLARPSDFQLQVPRQQLTSPQSGPETPAGIESSSCSARRSTQLLSPASAHRLTYADLGADSARRQTIQSRGQSMQVASCLGQKPPLLSLKKLNKRRIKVKFKTRRQLNERYLNQWSSNQASESNLQMDFEQQYDKSQQSAQMPDLFMIIYAVNDRESFEYAKTLVGQLRSINQEAPLPIVIVANKIDLERAKVVKSEEGRALAKRNACKYMEISCTIGHNVDNLLVGLRTQFILRHHTILNSVLRHGKSIKALNEGKPANNKHQPQQQQTTHRDNALVRLYKRYVVDNCELNYDCDNFSKL